MADDPTSNGTRHRLTGWGRTTPSVATVVHPPTREDVRAAFEAAGTRGLITRGLGRAYGDAAQNGGGTVLDGTALTAIGPIDGPHATITVGGGASLEAIQRAVLRTGWSLPVLPGTRHVTIGGAIASDVHGKNHHVDGSFGAHVESFTLQPPAGDHVVVTRASDAALFEATTGGMGLTGVVLAATLRLMKVETRLMRVHSERTADLDATMRALVEADATHRYSVAWLDLASPRARGRSVVTAADHARAAEAPGVSLLDEPPSWRPTVPPVVPVNLVRSAGVQLFNAGWFRRPLPSEALVPIESYAAPLDALGAWNRLYGSRGLVQYQFALPAGEETTLRAIVEAITHAPAVPALAVLKRFGPGNGAPLSFPIEGWTLAVDFPAGDPALGAFLDTLDERVAAAGGRVYLAKDARMRPEMVPLMYPRIDEWRETQARIDPTGVLTSDLDRRLHLTAGSTRSPR
ncbi:MAG: FAD-binding oxidoreductase [Chloroflexi bacterium]|nr:MAG: FAD-binding oxidoreductase [Chloroflexota bacterium]